MGQSETRTSPASVSDNTRQRLQAVRLGIALDWWAVIAAIVLAVLIRFNILPGIGWFK